MDVFSVRLKALRLAKPLTQKQTAEAVSVTERNYQSWEYGKAKPDFGNLLLLADLFAVSIDYLVGRSEVPGMR
jgi:transcriptional regulator with XRE-family HTH domain